MFTASKQAYRPPSARGREINFKLHDDEEPASNARSSGDCEYFFKLFYKHFSYNSIWEEFVNVEIKKGLNRGESDTYLTRVCRLLQSIENLEKVEKQGLSATTVTFISCREKLR